MTETLLSTRHAIVTIDRLAGLTRFARTEHPYDDVAQLDQDCRAILGALDKLDRPRLSLLVDLRAAPPRTDDRLDAPLSRFRPRLMASFARTALVVRTAVGRLQVNRLAKEDRTTTLVTQDEGEAVAYLMGATSKPPSSR
jgi:hypothetical protein